MDEILCHEVQSVSKLFKAAPPRKNSHLDHIRSLKSFSIAEVEHDNFKRRSNKPLLGQVPQNKLHDESLGPTDKAHPQSKTGHLSHESCRIGSLLMLLITSLAARFADLLPFCLCRMTTCIAKRIRTTQTRSSKGFLPAAVSNNFYVDIDVCRKCSHLGSGFSLCGSRPGEL